MKQSFSSWLLIILAITTLFLAIRLPLLFESLREHGQGNVSVVFTPGFESLQEAFSNLLVLFSLTFSISLAIIIFILEKSEKSNYIKFLSVITIILFASGLFYSLFYSLERPLTGNPITPTIIYMGLRLLLSGLAFTFGTLSLTIDPTKITKK